MTKAHTVLDIVQCDDVLVSAVWWTVTYTVQLIHLGCEKVILVGHLINILVCFVCLSMML